MPSHPIADCPHNPTFDHISKTLDRLDHHTERSAIAMEEMAKQSAVLANHEHRLNAFEGDLRECFGRLRKVEGHVSKEAGAEEVISQQRSFWNSVKIALAPRLIGLVLFSIYMIDRLDVSGKIAKFWKEMNG